MVIAAVYFVLAVAGAVNFARIVDRQSQGPRLRAAWAGRSAEARCTAVRTEETVDVEGVPITHSQPTLSFRTADGRAISFEERQRPLDVSVGDIVTVYYAEDAPEDATARTPSFGARRVRELTAGLGCVLALVSAGALAALL
ncbi:DUF3592 domain-containing protein [Streptomyces castrisilvae]|uniref:DUF3592 domain-containing protein n=1 Tax=Streptomyces castrisilvae TaxID=3033811 RepID=A0ABY9HU69_9ACTN|nr:DUF3592 domain-containing protein [Streptomyces sp. Mut1]WLQ37634.1 DUF3592 domain-containing protein [Streptomyces sp. Mut1]